MRLLVLFIALCIPAYAAAYVSVIADPGNATELLSIEDSRVSAEQFGKLNGFPHTYVFTAQQAGDFKASLFVHDATDQKHDVSIILVKQERRGVSEIARTQAKSESWESQKDALLVESFKHGGSIEAPLESGAYILEVSSPNNDGMYRLVLGTEEIKRGYFDNLRVLFEVKKLVGSPLYTTVLSPLLYVPLILLLLVCGVWLWYRKIRTHA